MSAEYGTSENYISKDMAPGFIVRHTVNHKSVLDHSLILPNLIRELAFTSV